MSQASERIARVVPPGLKITPAERDAVIEIAYLTVAADSKLTNDELDAFARITKRLYGEQQDPDVLLDKYGEWRDREEVVRRLREIGGQLSAPARGLAYRVAYGLAMCDLDSSDEEFEFDLQLIDALELTADQAAQLADDVQRALQG